MIQRRLFIACLLLTILPTAAARADEQTPADLPGAVRLVLPPVVYAVPGIEANLYFDNVALMLNRDNYAFAVTCDKGNQLAERWTFIPKAQDVGSYPIQVTVRDAENKVIARAGSTVRVVAADTRARQSLLLVGDSMTDTVYSFYPQRLLELDAADDSLELKLIGSRGLKNNPPDGPLRHEGYGGWTAQAFATSYGIESRKGIVTRPETGSPFIYKDEAGQPHLDFARYCKEFNGGVGPDALLIFLGANEIFAATDESVDQKIDVSLGFFDMLIQEFHKVRPDTAVGVALLVPPSTSQDGFRNYAGTRQQTRWQYRRNQHRMVERMLAKFTGRESERIYLVPCYLNLDTLRNYRTASMPPNAHAAEKVARVLDGVHPGKEGHEQIADSIYCWLKSLAAP